MLSVDITSEHYCKDTVTRGERDENSALKFCTVKVLQIRIRKTFKTKLLPASMSKRNPAWTAGRPRSVRFCVFERGVAEREKGREGGLLHAMFKLFIIIGMSTL